MSRLAIVSTLVFVACVFAGGVGVGVTYSSTLFFGDAEDMNTASAQMSDAVQTLKLEAFKATQAAKSCSTQLSSTVSALRHTQNMAEMGERAAGRLATSRHREVMRAVRRP